MSHIETTISGECSCCFRFEGKERHCKAAKPEIFINGFWVSAGDLGKEEAGKLYWINPVNILYLEAETDFSNEDDDGKRDDAST